MLKSFKRRFRRNITNKENWLSLLLGLGLVFSYAPFSYSWLMLIILPFWLTIIAHKPAKTAAKLGGLFAFGWFASGISWVHVSIDQFGGLPLAISLLLMLLLCCYLALFLALACYLSARFSDNKTVNLWLLIPFWLVCEFLRGTLFTGFPWLTLGYSQIDASLALFAPVIGENGISALMLICAVSLAHIINNEKQGVHALVILGITALTVYLNGVNWVTPTGEKVSVVLVQGNIKQEMKWTPELEWPTMLKYIDLTRQHYPADIIIWPESAITAVETGNNAQEFLTIADKSAALNNSAIITGIINYDLQRKHYYNSLIVTGKKIPDDNDGHYHYNHSNRYYKNHLLPIGEFVPFSDWLRPLAPFFNLPMSSFSRGDYVQPNLVANGYNILPLICFEVAFADQLSANLTPATDMLLTVSNDAWFGNSHGPHQHLDIVRMRALEFGRPFLRATNNGITATVDHHGVVTKRLPQFEEAVLKTQVELVEGMTPYAQWTRVIDWSIPLILFMLCAIRQFALRTKNHTQ